MPERIKDVIHGLRPVRAVYALLAASLILGFGEVKGQESWGVYQNSLYGYAVEHPRAGFAVTESERGLTLTEEGGRGQVDIYGAANAEGLGPEEFEKALLGAERIREITYSRRGRTWLAVSGYYRGDEERGDDLIFYAKFMFSADLSQVAAFEASYPVTERRRFDAIVEQMEDSLTSPQAAR